MNRRTRPLLAAITWAAMFVFLGGCTSPREYVRNGFKVGPNYCGIAANAAERWIDDGDARVRPEGADLDAGGHLPGPRAGSADRVGPAAKPVAP